MATRFAELSEHLCEKCVAPLLVAPKVKEAISKRMIKQLLNLVHTKYCDLSVACRSIFANAEGREHTLTYILLNLTSNNKLIDYCNNYYI